MKNPYRIWGIELSPYSVKVRSYFRYKGIPHEWIVRSPATQSEAQKYAKLPLIPVVATPEDEGLQDSTPILDAIEVRHPEPSIHPADPALAFLSALLEEFGDEWGNKWMFHYRWWREADQWSAAERLARVMTPAGTPEAQLKEATGAIRERMLTRIGFVGSSEKTKDQIEDSYGRTVDLLETHLESRPYLFGARPAFADFGLWGQIYNCWTDPTPGEILRERAPRVIGWVERMLEPKAEGEFESWDQLGETLSPLLEEQVAGLFLPWSAANARALASGESEFRVELAGREYEQAPQKYHAKSLKVLRGRYAAVADRSDLDPVLRATGCLPWLTEG